MAQLQDLLGHSSIEVTKVYTQFEDVELQEAHSRYSPVDEDIETLLPPIIQGSEEKDKGAWENRTYNVDLAAVRQASALCYLKAAQMVFSEEKPINVWMGRGLWRFTLRLKSGVAIADLKPWMGRFPASPIN